ncbi:hypothetical protein Q4E93_19845 [Flavitalea sp. BT771]|uniref:hypothetical protein n=1 Tax=Flavitalea sp. BT771 TaxID=3063329 RepID=UPI0026E246AB|nr:hypothetical protein [Flavitalea sp. BT771]MDO6432871.1 hypothetical protein [Flavitalea sp. BT771]MDV6221853.1 hypothetical protein [Flavitalea sp. BT771]
MKDYIIFVLLFISPQAFSQTTIPYRHTEISGSQYNDCEKIKYLDTNTLIKTRSKKITLPVEGKKSMVFVDNPEFEEYKYLGDIKNTKLSLVQMLGPNEEVYYLINRSTGAVDTLIGEPVFSKNMQDFACLNNPGTDEQQRIQICEIINGAAHTRAYINIKPYAFLRDINCIGRNALFAKTYEHKYWKITLK